MSQYKVTIEPLSSTTVVEVVQEKPSVIVVDNNRPGPAGAAGPQGEPGPTGANGNGVPSDGVAGQVLVSNGGSATYWSNANFAGSVNVDAQYTWTNNHTYLAYTTFSNNVGVGVPNTETDWGSSYITLALGAGTGRDSVLDFYDSSNTLTLDAYTEYDAANNKHNIIFTATDDLVFQNALADGFKIGSSIFEVMIASNPLIIANTTNIGMNKDLKFVSQIFGIIDTHDSKGTSGQILTSTGNTISWSSDIIGTANNANYLGGIQSSSYVNTSQLSTNLSNYQTSAGLASNVATLSANYASYILANNGIISNATGVYVNGNTGVVVNSAGVFVNSAYINTISSNNTNFVGTVSAANVVSNAQLTANLANYATTGSVTANASAAYTNAVSYVDGKSYVNTSQLSSNLSNYAQLSGATFTNNISVANTLTVTKHIVLGGIEENFITYANANGVFSFDCSNGTIFYLTTPAAAFTPSLTNITLSNNKITAVSFFINQGATPYITTSNVQIGSSTNTTINWQGGLVPAGTANKKDVVTLSIFNVSNTYTVIGQLTSFG